MQTNPAAAVGPEALPETAVNTRSARKPGRPARYAIDGNGATVVGLHIDRTRGSYFTRHNGSKVYFGVDRDVAIMRFRSWKTDLAGKSKFVLSDARGILGDGVDPDDAIAHRQFLLLAAARAAAAAPRSPAGLHDAADFPGEWLGRDHDYLPTVLTQVEEDAIALARMGRHPKPHLDFARRIRYFEMALCPHSIAPFGVARGGFCLQEGRSWTGRSRSCCVAWSQETALRSSRLCRSCTMSCTESPRLKWAPSAVITACNRRRS